LSLDFLVFPALHDKALHEASGQDQCRTFDELKEYSKTLIKQQIAQFGQTNPTEEELESIVARILSNKEEIDRLNEQLNTNKLLDYFKENAKLKTKEVTYDKFLKEMYA